MRLHLAVFAVVSSVLLSGPAAFAAERSKPLATKTFWRGKSGDWATKGTTTYTASGAKFSEWQSHNRRTGEMRFGSGDRGRRGESTVIIRRSAGDGSGSRTRSTKVPGQAPVKTTRTYSPPAS